MLATDRIMSTVPVIMWDGPITSGGQDIGVIVTARKSGSTAITYCEGTDRAGFPGSRYLKRLAPSRSHGGNRKRRALCCFQLFCFVRQRVAPPPRARVVGRSQRGVLTPAHTWNGINGEFGSSGDASVHADGAKSRFPKRMACALRQRNSLRVAIQIWGGARP